MAQTSYKRPFSRRYYWGLIVVLFAIFVVLLVKLGGPHPATLTFACLVLVVTIIGRIFDPELSYYVTQTTLDDGTVVPTRRPLVGFRRLETRFGMTGDYETRGDGWRDDVALIRL